ncbi:MAG TPA: YfiR family protein, partial [Caulobacteraceae bacterium]
MALAAVALAGAASAQAPDPADVAAKAAFLVKLAPFVDWPARPSASEPFVICVVGRDPFGPALDRAVVGQSAAGRPIVARRLARAERDAGCQIMYLGGSPTQSARDALTAVRAAPVLTV